MADDEVHTNGSSPPNETSPLLGDRQPVGDPENGVCAGDGADEAVVTREGLPEVAAKMHMLIPAIGIGIYLCAMDQLLTIASYARIGNDLNALNNTSWIATAYFLTLTSFQPLYGKLSDIFGRKECLLFAYAVFGLGCLGCGLSRSILELCIARAVAGIGGGGMNAVVSILITDIVPLRDRGVWQGYINIIFAAGTSTGAPLGGLLADTVGWRWSFIGQTPICLVAFIAVYFVLQLPRRTDAPVGSSHWAAKVAKIDFLGAVVLVSAVFSLLLGLDAGSNVGWSSVPHTIVPLSLAPVLFAIFLLVEIKVASHPFAPGHVILDSSMFAAYLANFFGVAGHIGPIFFLPLFYQAVDGFGATEAGLLLIPGMVAAVCASIGGGLIIRHTGRYYWVTVLSFGLLLLSIVPLVMFTGLVANSIVGITIGLIMLTLGAGSGITTTLVALISNAAQEDSAVAIACSYLFRSLGTSIGISAASAVLQQTLRTRLVEKLRDLPPDLGGGGEDRAREIEERVRQNLEYIGTLEPAVAAIVRRCYAVATQAAFVTSAAFLVCAFVSTWWIKEKRLGK